MIGIAPKKNIRRNADAKAGDALILTKPLGVGIYSAAIKKDALPHGGYGEMIATTTLLNRVGAELAKDADVHAITDVTGFGVLGHGLEMARGSGLTVALSYGALPLLAHAEALAQQGCVTGASHRKLEELRGWRVAPRWPAGLAAPPAHRSADIGWPAGRVRRSAR